MNKEEIITEVENINVGINSFFLFLLKLQIENERKNIESEVKESEEIHESETTDQIYNYEELNMKFSELEKELEMCVEV